MAKDESLKLNCNLHKRKKLKDTEIPLTEPMKLKVKKKRKHAEEATTQNNSITNSAVDETYKKEKKRKKKMTAESADPSRSEVEVQEPEGEEGQEKDLTPEEKRVLERKMKKIFKKEEKKRLRAEGRTAPKEQEAAPSACEQALDYLTCWAETHSVWKFQKTRQTWLLQHMFDSGKIPDEKFPVLLRYLEGLCGRAKDTTVQKALLLVEESGQAPTDAVVQQRAQRAREVIQLLS